MRNKTRIVAFAMMATLVTLVADGHAQSKADAAKPSVSKPEVIESRPDALIMEFTYHPRSVYEIRTRAGMFTSLQVPEGEKIQGFYLSDTVFWKYVVAKDGSRVFVRPSEAGRYNSGTMVTDKRVYELAFRSFQTSEPFWFQRVQWAREDDKFPGWGVLGDPAESMVASSVQPTTDAQAQSSKPRTGPAWDVDMTRANFGYAVIKSDVFAPRFVMDDGTFTYMQFGKLQDMPVIFAYDESPSQAQIVDYVVHNNNVLIHRVTGKGFLLKLGNREVIVEKTDKP